MEEIMIYKKISRSVISFLFPLLLFFGALPSQPYAQSIVLDPAQGIQGDTISVEISGTGTHFSSGPNTVDFGLDFGEKRINYTILTVSSSTLLTIEDLSIAPNAKVGPRDVTVTTTTTIDEVVTAPDGFTVIQGTGTTLDLVEPDWADQGIFLWDIDLYGSNTNFEQGLSEVSFSDSDITVEETVVVGPETLTATIAVDGWADTGPRTVIVATGCEEVSCSDCFEVTPAELVEGITPSSAEDDVTLTVEVAVVNGYTLDDTSELHFSGGGIEVINGITFKDTVITANIAISLGARGNLRDVIVVTGGEVAFGEKLFDVINPDIDRVSPGHGLRGSTLAVTILGIDTHFDSGSTVEFSGEGINLNSTSIESPSKIVVDITIDPDAPLGERDITVSTVDGDLVGEGIFSVYKPGTLPEEKDRPCSCAVMESRGEGHLKPEEMIGTILPFLLVMILLICLRSYLTKNS
jgi:hypothetical protein